MWAINQGALISIAGAGEVGVYLEREVLVETVYVSLNSNLWKKEWLLEFQVGFPIHEPECASHYSFPQSKFIKHLLCAKL